MKGHITKIEEAYPNAPHWSISIIMDRAERYHNMRIGWVDVWYPKDPLKQRYHCLIEAILVDRELFIHRAYVIEAYWSPESDVDNGKNLADLSIGDIEFEYNESLDSDTATLNDLLANED